MGNEMKEIEYTQLDFSKEVFVLDEDSSSGTSCSNRKKYGKRSRHQQLHCLLVWGCGEFGQHAHNHNKDVSLEESLKEVQEGRLVIADHSPALIASGSSHTLVLTDNNLLFSWGNGTSGQLGNNTCETSHKPVPVSVTQETKIQGMACGARHSFFWTKDGQCYSFGNNFNAQLGYNFAKLDFKDNQLKPILVEFFPGLMVKDVACGARHTIFLLTTGQVMAVGCNQHGQIGNGSTEDVVIPIKLEDLRSISHIACGNSHSLAADQNGQVYAWGYGKAFGTKTRYIASPQIFNQNYNCPVASMAAGDSHSMALYENGNLYTWGNNYEGQLGLGQSTKYQSEPKEIPDEMLPRPIIQISCGETTCAAITGEGNLYMWGKNAGLIYSEKPSQHFQFEPHLIETKGRLVKQVSCGAWHVAAIIENINEVHMRNESQESCNIKEVLLENVGETVSSGYHDIGSDNENSIQTEFTENMLIDKHTSPWVVCHKDILEDNQNNDRTIDYSEEKILSKKIENLHLDEEQHCANNRTTSTVEKSIVNRYADYTTSTETINVPENEENCSICDYRSPAVLDTTHTRLGKIDKETMTNELKRQNYQISSKGKKISQCRPTEAPRYTPRMTATSKKSRFNNKWNISLQSASKVSEDFNCEDICQERIEKTPQFSGLSEESNGDELSNIMEKDVDTVVFYNNQTKQQKRIVRNNVMRTLSNTCTSDQMSRPQTVPAVINLGFQNSPEKLPVPSRQNQQMNRRSSLQTNFKNIWKSSNLFREKQSKKVLNGWGKSHLDNELIFHLEHTCILPNSSLDASKIKKWTRYRDTNSPPDVSLNARQMQTDICLDHSGELLPAICSCTRKNILSRKGQTNIFLERKWSC